MNIVKQYYPNYLMKRLEALITVANYPATAFFSNGFATQTTDYDLVQFRSVALDFDFYVGIYFGTLNNGYIARIVVSSDTNEANFIDVMTLDSRKAMFFNGYSVELAANPAYYDNNAFKVCNFIFENGDRDTKGAISVQEAFDSTPFSQAKSYKILNVDTPFIPTPATKEDSYLDPDSKVLSYTGFLGDVEYYIPEFVTLITESDALLPTAQTYSDKRLSTTINGTAVEQEAVIINNQRMLLTI